MRASWLDALADDIATCSKRGCEVVVVTSGAIALGRKRLGLSGVLRLDEKQAASAAGQAALAQAWQTAFARHDVAIAQILLTLDDTENRRRYLNARATFRTLLDLGALPLVNENDTIATVKSATATTTGWRRMRRRSSTAICSSSFPTSMAFTPPIRAATPTPRMCR
ncbi:MAG: hypothetical protein R3C58_11440 [Parvularculaceae bacterium]